MSPVKHSPTKYLEEIEWIRQNGGSLNQEKQDWLIVRIKQLTKELELIMKWCHDCREDAQKAIEGKE